MNMPELELGDVIKGHSDYEGNLTVVPDDRDNIRVESSLEGGGVWDETRSGMRRQKDITLHRDGEQIYPEPERDTRICSGSESSMWWDEINTASTIEELRVALYTTGCKMQELESRIGRKEADDESH